MTDTNGCTGWGEFNVTMKTLSLSRVILLLVLPWFSTLGEDWTVLRRVHVGLRGGRGQICRPARGVGDCVHAYCSTDVTKSLNASPSSLRHMKVQGPGGIFEVSACPINSYADQSNFPPMQMPALCTRTLPNLPWKKELERDPRARTRSGSSRRCCRTKEYLVWWRKWRYYKKKKTCIEVHTWMYDERHIKFQDSKYHTRPVSQIPFLIIIAGWKANLWQYGYVLAYAVLPDVNSRG